MLNEYDTINDFICDMNDNRDIIFEYNGKQYFIDYYPATLIPKKQRKNYIPLRSISLFDPVERRPFTETRCNYSTIEEMLDDHFIDGKRLRDIIMDCKLLDLY